LSIYFGHLLCGQRPTATYVARCVVCDSVRENVCNNSKNVKIFVFLDFDKNVKNVRYVQFQRPLDHSGLYYTITESQ